MATRGQLLMSAFPVELTDLRERRVEAQLAEPWLSYSINDDLMAFVKKHSQPSGWKGWTPLSDLSTGTDTDKQGPSSGKFMEDG